MCKVILSLVTLAGVITSVSAIAGTSRLSATYDMTQSKGDTSVLDLNAGPDVRQLRNTLSYEGEFSSGFNMATAVSSVRPDYSATTITEANGSQYFLADKYPNALEYSGNLLLGYNKGTHIMSVSYLGNLSDSPYARKAVTATIKEGFFERTTILGLSATKLNQLQPATTFIDRDYKTKARPTEITGHSVTGSWEQIVSSNWKSLLELNTQKREEDRPRNYGLSLTQGVALSNRVFGQVIGKYVAENTHEELKDERGYFTLRSGQFNLTFEPIYDFLLTFSYGIMVETEKDPRIGSEVQVGSDQVGMGVRYTLNNCELNFSSSYIETNTSRRGLQMMGGISWLL